MTEWAVQQTTWYFVDESGDPGCFDRNGKVILGLKGSSPILMLGCTLKCPIPIQFAWPWQN